MKCFITLYSDLPSSEHLDAKFAGDIISMDAIKCMEVIPFFFENEVEFTVDLAGRCLIDLSYDYYETSKSNRSDSTVREI